MTRVWVPATPRKAMTPARRARVLERYGHRCALCLVTHGLEIDHIVPLELGGSEEDDNLQPLCQAHHKVKTAADIKAIRKAARIRKRLDGTRRERKAIQGRGFDKRLRRRMNGVVEKRDGND